MAGSIALFLAAVAALEILRGLRLVARFQDLAALGARSSRLLLRVGVSEWAKERALGLASRKLLGASLDLGARLALTAMPFALILLLDHLKPFGAGRALTDWPVRLVLLAAVLAYGQVRRRLRQGKGSPRAERLLQQATLGCPPVTEMALDIERRLHGPAAFETPEGGPPVFICGLARAGTTILTRLLHETGAFACLTYRDLPFPLAPNAWNGLARNARRNVASSPRGHGDGMLHDLDSPEAIEEVFWLSQEGRRYRKRDGLAPTAPADETIALFHDYAALVRLRYGRPRYLSKNNNNVLRLPALVAAFPEAVLLHPFRDPLQQAASLLDQHRRALVLAQDDPFRRRFMTWLGHHEFGADQRPFLFAGAPGAAEDAMRLDYWLKAWISVHAALCDQPPEIAARQLFVDYDQLCVEGPALAAALAAGLGLNGAVALSRLSPPRPHALPAFDPRLAREAYRIHATLRARAFGVDGPRQRADAAPSPRPASRLSI